MVFETICDPGSDKQSSSVLPLPPLHLARGDGTRVPPGQSRASLSQANEKCDETVINLQNLSVETI